MTLHPPINMPNTRTGFWQVLYLAVAAFCTYSCMYAFRKPFTAATFGGLEFANVHYKVWLVFSQLLGYTFSKFYGIRFISESVQGDRTHTILILIILSWMSLLGFALVPPPYNIPFLFMNGLPLGMVWGLVFSYIEGRRSTDFLGAVLCVSFIFSSGFVKSVGISLMLYWNIPEFWMPFVTGLVFLPPLFLSLKLLRGAPPVTLEDVRYRMLRRPMSAYDRRQFLLRFLPGLVTLVFLYLMLTVIRDLRDNFVAEIWIENGISDPGIFTVTEIPVSLAVLVLISLMVFVRNNKHALFLNHLIVLTGLVIPLLATVLFRQAQVSVINWVMLSGLGLYMAYVSFNSVFFDRLIAYLRVSGTVGFLIYLADSLGYLGSFGILVYREFFTQNISWTKFLGDLFLLSSMVGIVCVLFSWWYFSNQKINRYA